MNTGANHDINDEFFCNLHFINYQGKYQKYIVKKSDDMMIVRNTVMSLFKPKDNRVFLTFDK